MTNKRPTTATRNEGAVYAMVEGYNKTHMVKGEGLGERSLGQIPTLLTLTLLVLAGVACGGRAGFDGPVRARVPLPEALSPTSTAHGITGCTSRVFMKNRAFP